MSDGAGRGSGGRAVQASFKGTGGLRITGGKWRGRKVRVPTTARPTKERVREAVWARWQTRVRDAHVLELYAGSGAMSLEALSRGASTCVAVEQSAAALRVLLDNAQMLGGPLKTVRAQLPGQWGRVEAELEESVDLVFLDPPYDVGVSTELLSAVVRAMSPDARMAAEHDRRSPVRPPSALRVEEVRRYGETAVTYLRQP